MPFNGKIAVVTGAGSGMGEATAQLLAVRGATVVLAGRSEERIRAAADRIIANGGKAVIRATDVTVRADLEGLMEWIGHEFGRLDFAVNNAGGHADFKPLHETPADESDWVFDLNLKSVYNGMRAQIALMLRNDGGAGGGAAGCAIVNNASIFGLKGVAGIAHYVAAKHGVVGLTKAAALDYANAGIRINSVCPGATETPNLLRVTGGDAHALDAMIPFDRLGQPVDVARTICWLLSAEAAYVTGANFSVDGGMSAG